MKYISFALLIIVLSSCAQKTEETAIEAPKGDLITDSSIIAHPVWYQYSEKEHFSILSWNVEHFVDPYDNPYINNWREDSPATNRSEKVQLFINALRKADADIVVLQEFESEAYLMSLAKDSFPDLGYEFFSDAASPTWYMNVVLMSRFPLGVMHSYGEASTPVSGYVNEEGEKQTQNRINSRMWSVKVYPSKEYSFWLTAVHLKAGGGERNTAMRLGQIHLLQEEFKSFEEADPNANILMAGDFNAYPKSEVLKELSNSKSLYPQMIDLLDTNINTHPADSPYRRLDYILMNANMQAELLQNSLRVAQLFSSDSMRLISDHLPVKAEFYREEKE